MQLLLHIVLAMLQHTANDIRQRIIDFNNLSIEEYLNEYILQMYHERLFSINVPLLNYSKNDTTLARDLLKDAGFKYIFNKCLEGQYESITVIV